MAQAWIPVLRFVYLTSGLFPFVLVFYIHKAPQCAIIIILILAILASMCALPLSASCAIFFAFYLVVLSCLLVASQYDCIVPRDVFSVHSTCCCVCMCECVARACARLSGSLIQLIGRHHRACVCCWLLTAFLTSLTASGGRTREDGV